jgi:predicted ferric reductase
MICNQFFLASKPSFAVKTLGIKGLVSFHSTMPVLIIVVALAHKLLKESNGYSEDSFQATFGSVAWWILAVVIVFTVLFMANTFWLKLDVLKKLKTFVYEKTGLNYKTTRLLHNATVITGVIILIHVFLASSSSYTVNFAGIAVMACWMLFSLFAYFVYRLKGRKI